jgi:glycosyltransferase involved in cell wall biosynthesis
MAWSDQAANPFFALGSTLLGSLRLRTAGNLDGAVMIGSGYEVRAKLPVATFEDMTVSQAREQGDPAYERLSEKALQRWSDRQRRIYRRVGACCVASHWAADSVVRDYGVDPAKVHVVGFGHNVELEVPERSWEQPRFLWVGADWERKRGAAILEAFRTVRERYPDARLDFVGAHPEISEPGVVGHGRLALGSDQGQREYLDLLREATCYVMPSSYEPLGIAYIDAATAGVPSIGTTSGGAVDAVAEGGVVVDPNDQAALLRAMLELAEPDRAAELGLRARERSDVYTWRKVAERILRALAPQGVDTDSLEPDVDDVRGVARVVADPA